MKNIIRLVQISARTLVVIVLIAATAFSLGWWVSRNAFEGALLELAGKKGFTTLIFPDVVTDTGVYGPTGRAVPFLGSSEGMAH